MHCFRVLASFGRQLATRFQKDLERYRHISGCETFFQLWDECGRDWKMLLSAPPSFLPANNDAGFDDPAAGNGEKEEEGDNTFEMSPNEEYLHLAQLVPW